MHYLNSSSCAAIPAAPSGCDDREPGIGGIKQAEELVQRSRVAVCLDAFQAVAREHAQQLRLGEGQGQQHQPEPGSGPVLQSGL